MPYPLDLQREDIMVSEKTLLSKSIITIIFHIGNSQVIENDTSDQFAPKRRNR